MPPTFCVGIATLKTMGRARKTGCYAHMVEQRRALPSGGPPGVGGPIEAADTASSLVKRTAVFCSRLSRSRPPRQGRPCGPSLRADPGPVATDQGLGAYKKDRNSRALPLARAWAVFSASKTGRKGDSVPGLYPSGLW